MCGSTTPGGGMQSGSIGLIIGMAMKLTPALQFSSSMLAALCLLLVWPASGQELAKRLILKDGSYQLASKWEVKGDRVRYFSAERGEWEEVPKSMVDWSATEKYAKDRDSGVPLPGAVELDKELAAERQAEEAKTPEVAPGLRLPQDGGVLLLDVFDNDPQLVELHQNSGEINPDRKGNILRAAINPVASTKQNVELAGLHAKIQAHVGLPAIYIRLELRDQAANPSSAEGRQAPEPWDRFRIVRMQTKQDKRIAGDIKVAIYGKFKEEEKLIPSGAVQLTGGWVKVTPSSPLSAGEYAMVEMMGNEGINLYVWDFGVNPSAPANDLVLRPDKAVPASTQPDRAPDLEPRP